MKRVLYFFIVLSIFLHSEQGNTQKNYTVAHYTGDNGLPQNSIKSIAADSQGFIWMGTEDGLVRYDGNHLQIFNRFNLNITNTRSRFMQAAVRNKDLARAGHVHGRNAVSYVYFMDDQAVKIENGKASRDTAYYNQNERHFKPLEQGTDLLIASGLPNFVHKMYMPSRYLVRTGNRDDEFFICDNKKFIFYSKWKKKYQYAISISNVWNYFTIGDNLYYFSDDRKGFKSFSAKEVLNQQLSGAITENPSYKGHTGQIRIYWNDVADQAYLYLDKNLYSLDEIRDKKSGSTQLTTRLLIEDFDMVSNGIEKIYRDEVTGKIFLGSGTEGLFILSKHQFLTINVKGDSRENVFYAQLPYGENSVLTATGKIVGRDSKTGHITVSTLPLLAKVNTTDKVMLVKDKDQTIWTKLGNRLFHLTAKGVLDSMRFDYYVQTIYQGQTDKIWLGIGDQGLFYIDPAKPDRAPEMLFKEPFFNTTAMKALSKDRLFVGTPSGLYAVDISARRYQLVAGTKGLHIKSIYIDQSKNIWLTALERGIMLLTPKEKLIAFPLDNNRYLASPHCIISDGLGFLWIPTNKGLFQVSNKDLLDYAQQRSGAKSSSVPAAFPASELFYSYHAMDEGFKTNEFNGSCEPCGVKLNNEYISLPSLNGLVWFRPEQIRKTASDGDIIFDRAEVNKVILPISNDTLKFPLYPEQIKLYFSTAYFGNPYNLKISYALLKENAVAKPSDWIALDDENFRIEFSNLYSGNYTLLVRKLNGFGINNYTIKKIYFFVPLLWYQTLWANILMVIGLLAGVYFYNLWRLKNVKNENARLEEVVAKRTKRLNETLTDLEDSKNEMAQQVHMLSRLLTSMTHDIQSPLNFIKLTSGNIPKLIQKGQLDDVALLGEVISETSGSMSSLLGGLLDYIKAHVYENSLHFEEINLRQLVDAKFGIFKNMISENGSDFSNEIPEDTQVYCDYQMLGIMIHNLIDNAAKFTRRGQIRIYFNVINEKEEELVISNTTVGIPKEIQDMINAPKKENTQSPVLSGAPGPGQARTSLGLLIVKEIAALVGISLKVSQSSVTSFHLKFNSTN